MGFARHVQMDVLVVQMPTTVQAVQVDTAYRPKAFVKLYVWIAAQLAKQMPPAHLAKTGTIFPAKAVRRARKAAHYVQVYPHVRHARATITHLMRFASSIAQLVV